MQLLSYLTDAARIAPFREMARIIWINLLANHRVARTRTGSHLIALPLAFVSPWIAERPVCVRRPPVARSRPPHRARAGEAGRKISRSRQVGFSFAHSRNPTTAFAG